MKLVAMTGNEPTTTSLIIAEGVDVQHKNILELLRKHLSDFEEFGRVAFETRVAGQSPNPTKYAVLNREHAMLLMTYMRNTPIVRTFKKNLVRAFTDMERALDNANTPAIPQNYAEALREAANQFERAELEASRADKAEEKAEHLDSWKRAVEGGAGINVSDYARKYFSEVPYMAFFEHLYKRGWLIDQRGTRVDRHGNKKNGYDHMKPTAKGRKFFYLHDKGVQGGKRRFQTKVIPKRELELKEALVKEGLTPNENQTGLVLIDGQLATTPIEEGARRVR